MMERWSLLNFLGICLVFLFQLKTCVPSVQNNGSLPLGFRGDQMHWIDNKGLFLLSNDSNFGFGFITTQDVTLFLLAVVHLSSSTTIWSANRATPVKNSDNFVFNATGNAYLQSGESIIWSTNTANKGVSVMELQNSGNLVLLADDGSIIWQSFSHPADTLLSNQVFSEGMKLVSDPGLNNLSYFLEMKSGDLLLYANFVKPQPYWSMGQDSRKIINKNGGGVTLASLDANSWRFYDKNKVLLWQFIFSNSDTNSTWAATLGGDGFITFYTLGSGRLKNDAPTKIPADYCSRPQPCGPYQICGNSNNCQCPAALASQPNCRPDLTSRCSESKGSMELVDAGDGLGYFALGLVPPSSKTDLSGCKSSCLDKCSCLLMFFENKTGNCFHFDHVGSLQSSKERGFASYIKISSTDGNGGDSGSGGSSKKHVIIIAIIVVATTLVILVLLFAGVRYFTKSVDLPESPKENFEEDNFLDNISGMPVRFTYRDLQVATKDFSAILGQGGFGSVYEGVLPDGTRLAVKQLEGIGQGKKEFRAEVSIIGSIHHLHLVKLKGFCAEGVHRLLVYEFMANGSLDRWIFNRNKSDILDWDRRYNIALGTAKGLAYLHEDCDVKIVHCDIKPENVLLDDNFLAKVSDFGLAKLMSREQSHVFTTLRGTRGYLAPEWITNYAISEKSDVYSYGMVLLEIIGGRKNYDASETSEKSHFPSYAFKMMEEGKLTDILDANLKTAKTDKRVMVAIKVALWCIQDDMASRPSMTKVVQMLEGLYPVPPPPLSSQMNARLYSSFYKTISEDGTSSGPSDCNSDAYLSAVRLSGPR